MYNLFFQLCRFGIVGLTAATVQFSLVVILVQYFQYAPLVANVMAFMVSVQVSYWGHRMWTFNDTTSLHIETLPKLLTLQLCNLLASEALFYLFLSLHLPYRLALLIVISILPIFTFLFSKFWVFRVMTQK